MSCRPCLLAAPKSCKGRFVFKSAALRNGTPLLPVANQKLAIEREPNCFWRSCSCHLFERLKQSTSHAFKRLSSEAGQPRTNREAVEKRSSKRAKSVKLAPLFWLVSSSQILGYSLL